jgi:glycosyltransferase involved in cell wall biosynthesis
LRDVFEYAKATGKVVGYEFDDLLIGKHGFFREPGKHGEKSLGDYIEEQVKGADFVTVTTPYLKEVVAKSRGNNKNIYIIKNRLPLDVIGKYMPKIKKAKEKGEIRIGWAGGKYHFGNVFAMREVMKKLHDKYGDRLTFVFKGFNSENMLNPNEKKALSEFENFFKKNSIKYELHGYTPFSKGWENYYKELGKLNLDIFFSPAVEFNPENPEYWQHEAKSELKYLEAAFIGAPIVTPAIGGHKHEVKHMKTGMLVNPKNREEGFYRSLDYLIANPEEREYIARAARKDLIEKRDAEISSTELATVFAEQIQRKKGKPMEEVLMEEAA